MVQVRDDNGLELVRTVVKAGRDGFSICLEV